MDTRTKSVRIGQRPVRPSVTIVPNWVPGVQPGEGSTLLEAALARNFSSPFTTPLYSLGDYDDSVNGFAQEILYCKLQVSMSANVTPTSTFMDGSGIFWDPTKATLTQTDIQAFVANLRYGPPTIKEPLYNSDAPNIVVKAPCYVIIELHPPQGLKFVSGDAAIKLRDDLSEQYCNLWHYGVDWVATQDISPTTEDCLLIYFGVVTVDDASLHINDRFNINLQTGDQPSATLVVIDPAIKNRGPKHPTPPIGNPTLGRKKLKEKEPA